jgi:DNA-binding response OmpR family regulator
MACVLLIGDDRAASNFFAGVLRSAGYDVLTADSGSEALRVLDTEHVDVGLLDLQLPDMSGLDLLRTMRSAHQDVSSVIVTGAGSTRSTVAAMRLGAVDVLDKPLPADDLLRCVGQALGPGNRIRGAEEDFRDEPHAAVRWAQALIPVLDSPKDTKTITTWARLVVASPGALRNWCRTAHVPPRRSLVFARMLRVVQHSGQSHHRPENLLDVVDRRTLLSVIRLAGFPDEASLPRSVDDFLNGQILVRDSDTLHAVRALLVEREARQGRQS